MNRQNYEKLMGAVFGKESARIADLACPDCGQASLRMVFAREKERVDAKCTACGYVAMFNGITTYPPIDGIRDH